MREEPLIQRLESLEVSALFNQRQDKADTLQEARHDIISLRAKVMAQDVELRKERTKFAKACDLVESCITFAGEQLLSLPGHEHCDGVLEVMEADLAYFIDETQSMLEELRGNQ